MKTKNKTIKLTLITEIKNCKTQKEAEEFIIESIMNLDS